VAPAALLACTEESTGPLLPPPETTELTVDASTTPAFIRLGEPSAQVSVSSPTTSTAWDLSFFATSVSVNGGASGPGGVSAHCLCANANATVAELQAMTAENQLAAFDAVTVDDVPATSAFVFDALNPAISGWYSGEAAAATAATTRTWIIRRSFPNVILGKFRVTAISGATAANAGAVTVEYAVQPSTGSAFGPVSTATLSLASGPAYLDLSSGQVAASARWDLQFSGFEIRTNGGVSGSGGVAALLDATTPFAQITADYAASAPPVAYRSDAFSGVFATSPWYRYNITGTDNQIWPNFNVYLVRRGNDTFKVQVTSYYGPTGTSRQITVRSAKVE
jgi:hypothetical protein